jgi:hypothetical protein
MNSLKSWAMNCGPVVADDAWGGCRVEFAGALQDALDLLLCHGLAEVPVDHRAAAPVEDGDEAVERAGDADVRDVLQTGSYASARAA